MRSLRILLALLSALLLSCGGGGDPAAPATAADMPSIAVAPGTFYRQEGTVIVGQTVTAVASLPAGGTPVWRLVDTPRSIPPPVLVTEAGAQQRASLLVNAVGIYRLELIVDDGTGRSDPVYATFTSIPTRIEFMVDVRHDAGTTTTQVHGGAANAPVIGCLVYSGTGCTAPTAVEAVLDGVSLGSLTARRKALKTVQGRLKIRLTACVSIADTFHGATTVLDQRIPRSPSVLGFPARHPLRARTESGIVNS